MGRWAQVKAKRGNQETPHVALGFFAAKRTKRIFHLSTSRRAVYVAPRWNRGAWRIAVVSANDTRE
jgi:hypothetical protein